MQRVQRDGGGRPSTCDILANSKGGAPPASTRGWRLAQNRGMGWHSFDVFVIDYEPAVSEVPKAMEFEGHKILEVKRLNITDWEIIIQKQEGNYII